MEESADVGVRRCNLLRYHLDTLFDLTLTKDKRGTQYNVAPKLSRGQSLKSALSPPGAMVRGLC